MKKSDSDISRRDFLRGLSIITATLATGPGLRSLAEVLGQNNGRKLGIALLGLGRYSTNQLGPALRETKLCYLVLGRTRSSRHGHHFGDLRSCSHS